MENKIKTYEEIKEIISTNRKNGKKTVFTNGCFDILHIGHTRYLKSAKKLGDILIVAINSDSSVKMNKTDKRPIVPQDQRAELISSLSFVDYVFIFPDKNLVKILGELKPEIYCKGGDYKIDSINQEERRIIEDYGGKIQLINVAAETSTSKIIDKIRSFGDFK